MRHNMSCGISCKWCSLERMTVFFIAFPPIKIHSCLFRVCLVFFLLNVEKQTAPQKRHLSKVHINTHTLGLSPQT